MTNELREVASRGVHVRAISVRPVRAFGLHVPHVDHVRLGSARPTSLALVAAFMQAARRRPVAALRATLLALRAWIPGRGLDLLQALQVLAILDETPDRVHAHFAMRGASVGSIIATALGTPFSFTAHAWDIFVYQRDVARLHHLADVCVAVCKYNARYQATRWPEASAIVVVPCGVDVEQFSWRDRMPVDRGHVMAVGRLVAKKGFMDLVDAVAIAVAEGADLRLDIVGDGPLRDELSERIAELDLQERVALHGAAPHEEVARRLEESSLLALPCVVADDGDRDSQPLVVKEAMARGVPCVVTDEVGLPEMVDEETGWVVPAGDPEALAGALVEAWSVPDHVYLDRARAARRRVEARFALDVTIPELLDAFFPGGQ